MSCEVGKKKMRFSTIAASAMVGLTINAVSSLGQRGTLEISRVLPEQIQIPAGLVLLCASFGLCCVSNWKLYNNSGVTSDALANSLIKAGMIAQLAIGTAGVINSINFQDLAYGLDMVTRQLPLEDLLPNIAAKGIPALPVAGLVMGVNRLKAVPMLASAIDSTNQWIQGQIVGLRENFGKSRRLSFDD